MARARARALLGGVSEAAKDSVRVGAVKKILLIKERHRDAACAPQNWLRTSKWCVIGERKDAVEPLLVLLIDCGGL